MISEVSEKVSYENFVQFPVPEFQMNRNLFDWFIDWKELLETEESEKLHIQEIFFYI